jgi:hypothetical protein
MPQYYYSYVGWEAMFKSPYSCLQYVKYRLKFESINLDNIYEIEVPNDGTQGYSRIYHVQVLGV